MRSAETVFSLMFGSAGKGPFMAGKAKNAPKAHVPGGGKRSILQACPYG